MANAKSTKPIASKGWIPLLLLLVINLFLGMVIVSGTSIGLREETYTLLLRGSFGILTVLAVFSIAGLYYDRRYVAKVSSWSPSVWYFLMFAIPLLGYLLTAHYLYKRHKYVGRP